MFLHAYVFVLWWLFRLLPLYVTTPSRTPDDRQQSLNITAATSGHGYLILGDSEGFIHQVDRSFQISSFQGFAWDCTFLLQLKTNKILIGLGVRHPS